MGEFYHGNQVVKYKYFDLLLASCHPHHCLVQQQQQALPKETKHLASLDHAIAKCNKFDYDDNRSNDVSAKSLSMWHTGMWATYQIFIWHQQLVDEGSN